jgi:L-aminopeptidase/D-esterase-like protein
MKGLTDIPGLLVGHASDYDGLTGCTAVLCEGGAVAGGDIRGSAGSRNGAPQSHALGAFMP